MSAAEKPDPEPDVSALERRYRLELTEAAVHLEIAAACALRIFTAQPRRHLATDSRYLDRAAYHVLSMTEQGE